MGVKYNPGIVTSGLSLYLDAGSSKSYPGSGTTWYDLTNNGYNGTLTNGPTYSSGGINFVPQQYISVPYDSDINSATTFTVDMWFKSSNIGNEQVLFSTALSGTPSTGWHIELYQQKVILQVYPSGSYTFSTISLNSNVVYNIAATYNSGSISYYVNGVTAGTASYSFTPSTNILTIGVHYYTLSASLGLSGTIYSTKFYNRALSEKEVQQNFNALRGRYGI